MHLNLVLLVVVALLLTGSSRSAGHTCIHDGAELQAQIRQDLAAPPLTAHISTHTHFRMLAVGPLRIAVSLDDLYNSNQYCTAAGDRRPDFKGNTITCTAADVFNASRRDALVNVLLPTAVSRLASYYTLNQVSANIVVPQGACTGGFTIPANHSTIGVPNADYVLYVAAGQTIGSNIAWAGGCRSDGTGRIIVGRANFGPSYLDPPVLEQNIQVALHEIHHALGFTIQTLNATGKAVPITIRGKSTYMLTTPNVVAQARLHLNCSTLQGMELEDEGNAGSVLSHWEKRIVADEFMTASSDSSSTVSALTFAAMQDLGFYTPNYTLASPMWFGKNAGCSFSNDFCNVTTGGRDKYFCFDDSHDYCVPSNLKGYGQCRTATWGSIFSYFQWYAGNPTKGGYLTFYDFCPIIQAYSNGDCTDSTTGVTNNITGYYFGASSRCFSTAGLLKNGFTMGANPVVRCLDTQCLGGTQLQVRVGYGAWYSCTSPNQVLTIAGYQGTVTCPSDPRIICPMMAIVTTTAATTTTTATTSTTQATTTITTISSTISSTTAPTTTSTQSTMASTSTGTSTTTSTSTAAVSTTTITPTVSSTSATSTVTSAPPTTSTGMSTSTAAPTTTLTPTTVTSTTPISVTTTSTTPAVTPASTTHDTTATTLASTTTTSTTVTGSSSSTPMPSATTTSLSSSTTHVTSITSTLVPPSFTSTGFNSSSTTSTTQSPTESSVAVSSTTTSAPTTTLAGVIRVLTLSFKITGTRFGILLNSVTLNGQLKTALTTDLAALFHLPASSFAVTSMVEGSLVATVRLSTTSVTSGALTDAQATSTLQTVQNAAVGGTTSMPATAALYGQATGSTTEVLSMVNATAVTTFAAAPTMTTTTVAPDTSIMSLCSMTCYIAIAAVVGVLLIVIGIVIFVRSRSAASSRGRNRSNSRMTSAAGQRFIPQAREEDVALRGPSVHGAARQPPAGGRLLVPGNRAAVPLGTKPAATPNWAELLGDDDDDYDDNSGGDIAQEMAPMPKASGTSRAPQVVPHAVTGPGRQTYQVDDDLDFLDDGPPVRGRQSNPFNRVKTAPARYDPYRFGDDFDDI